LGSREGGDICTAYLPVPPACYRSLYMGAVQAVQGGSGTERYRAVQGAVQVDHGQAFLSILRQPLDGGPYSTMWILLAVNRRSMAAASRAFGTRAIGEKIAGA
jgi:hypothetical protein